MFSTRNLSVAAGLMLGVFSSAVWAEGEPKADGWWDHAWAQRKKITVNTTDKGVAITDAIGTSAVLVRLHEGNFSFTTAKDDGSDLRFVAEDGKTLLKHHVERFDPVLYEAFVWVKVPDIKGDASTSFWLYSGNSEGKAERVDDAKGTYDEDTSLVYHFSEKGSPASDASTSGIAAENAGNPVTGAQIAGGVRLNGQDTIKVPAHPALVWGSGASFTWSSWVKPTALVPGGTIFTRREEANALVIGVDNGVPYVEVNSGGTVSRSSGGQPLAVNVWRHLSVVGSAGQVQVLLDGETYATLSVGAPALNSPSVIGKDAAAPSGAAGFAGELDELQISKVARSTGFLRFAAVSQGGGEKAAKVLSVGQDEQAGEGAHENELAKHLTLITDISKSLTLDGWVVIVLCAILAVVGWGVSLAKFFYLNRIGKATTAFLSKWEKLSPNLSVLNHGDEENIKSMGGLASPKVQRLLNQSPVYHIYKIGSSEIQHRLSNAQDGFMSLSGRSIQAIRATLDGGLVREVQKLNSKLVFLTIGIAGGPYLGLLGTVIGVMITFAVIAKSGEVEVNSIAPGIAGALLATVAGLAVAIPALFAYSYISSRIKDAVSEMQIFIDEFVAKIAEVFSE